MTERAIDCRSEEGETVALIDAAIIALRLAARRSLTEPAVLAALADLYSDKEVRWLLMIAETTQGEQR